MINDVKLQGCSHNLIRDGKVDEDDKFPKNMDDFEMKQPEKRANIFIKFQLSAWRKFCGNLTIKLKTFSENLRKFERKVKDAVGILKKA